MRLLVSHMQGKHIRYKREFRFECELQVYIRHGCNCMSIITLFFIHKSLEGQWKNLIYDICFLSMT